MEKSNAPGKDSKREGSDAVQVSAEEEQRKQAARNWLANYIRRVQENAQAPSENKQ